jgi:hypothetical protein
MKQESQITKQQQLNLTRTNDEQQIILVLAPWSWEDALALLLKNFPAVY